MTNHVKGGAYLLIRLSYLIRLCNSRVLKYYTCLKLRIVSKGELTLTVHSGVQTS